ncbi:chemotaxis protein CheA [Ramlibacter sp. MAHUQ-53]|uniref:chemotaxis protein CheA n=1 Tax=unclassified Ramlibacter TaxID=2617605 RepID=UPI00364444E6
MSTTTANGNAGFDLTQFYQVFFEEAGDNLAAMERLLLGLDTGQADDETLNAIFRCAHSVKGGAATFGFSDIAELTHVMETLLDRLRRHELAPAVPMVDALLAAGDSLREMLDRRQQGEAEPVDATQLKATLVALANGSATPAAAPAPATAPAAAVAAPAAAPVATPVTPCAPAAAPAPDGARDLEVLAGPLSHPSLADDLLSLFAEVAGLGEMRRVPDLPGQGEGAVRLRLDPTASDADRLDLCDFHVPRDHIRITPWPQDAEIFDVLEIAAPAASAAAGLAPPAEAAPVPVLAQPAAFGPAAPAPAAAAAAPAPARKAAATETIRVSVDKVDQLINMMGELVITQAMLAQRAASLDEHAVSQLAGGLADLERTTRDLQESVMSIRMIPMGEVFGRFPRMLRDLAAKLGKEIELTTIGEATELDKGMIEKLTDPLTHLVRNAVDHGIELPEARVAAGKPRHGTLTLSAAHEGGSILIQVRDDGRGLDREKLLDKARRNGLPLSENMTDPQVWQLIFAPGFSTAETVTDVSGRGVGMDVVKRNIVALGGSVELSSTPGRGMCVSVRLPLTLAIMDGMSVTSCGELYLLPLSCVVESFQADAEALKRMPGDARVVRVREDWLPVVDLADNFHPGALREGDPRRMHVVVEAEGRRVALEVDQLVGQQQVVVKNLEANYRRVPGFSGATIMADGRVALILDVARLVRATAH